MRTDHRKHASGQILILFAISLVAMIGMLGLLIDGGHSLALRRQLQDAGDAAALRAANVLTQSGPSAGCSGGAGPRSGIVDAARQGARASLPGLTDADIQVSCPSGWSNYAVQVNLASRSPGYFSGIFGMNGFQVQTTSQAVNGHTTSIKYSVVELNPSNIGWPGAYNGCPSVLFSGGNNVIFDGSVQVNSACSPTNGGALSSNGNSATVQLNSGATINLVGGYVPGPLTLTPTPLTGRPPVKDPLRNLPPIPYDSWAPSLTQATSQTTLSVDTVLKPGVYVGGITMKNNAVAYLLPGIYVMKNAANGTGGFQIGGQNKVYSIPANQTSTTDLAWATDCGPTNCGVLIFNTDIVSNAMSGPGKDNISVGAGATLRLRPYVSTADGTRTADWRYNNLLVWQDKLQLPGPSYAQPPISLSGGGQISISGTVYAPSAAVEMGGTSGGAGGSLVDVTLQFVSWDLKFSGNIGFRFYYQDELFARPTDYGLVK